MKLPIAVWLAGLGLCASASAQVTQRVSLDSGSGQGDQASGPQSISSDGRYVAFVSFASNLVPGDSNGYLDAFVRDRLAGTTERVSLAWDGTQGNWLSRDPSISGDGRYVAFFSLARNLVPGDTNLFSDIFVRDRQSSSTERVSVDSSGGQTNSDTDHPSISGNGRYVAFDGTATNLVSGDTNFASDVFVHDRMTGLNERVSVGLGGIQGNDSSMFTAISADGRYVAFASDATNLVAGDTNGWQDIFIHDRQSGVTELVSVSSAGVQGNNPSIFPPEMSDDGRFVAFLSGASNLVPGDTNGAMDIFVRDRQNGTTERASVDSNGVQGNGGSTYLSISGNGRCVGFSSVANNLVVGDSNGCEDIFVRDLQSQITERVSVNSGGTQGNQDSRIVTLSADGGYVAFMSYSTNLCPADTNGREDAFVRDRSGGPIFTSLCDPAVGGVIPCPCANAPSGSGRGCDNSAHTGGAVLSASGGTYLSSDSLVFTTSGEKPTALSIVSQWNSSIATGVVFGMGVRCGAGALKRLYTKIASGGSIMAPNFTAGDPQVSARSAALGDAIQAGQSRWYLVYYRDPIVLGGCPATSTFNATQTGQLTWSP